MPTPSFFCCGDWLKSAMQFEDETRIITVFSNQKEIVAVLPLSMTRNLLGGTVAHFLGSRFNPDPLGLICATENIAEAATCIRNYFENETDWDQLTIDWTTHKECKYWNVEGEAQSIAPYLTLEDGFEGVLHSFRKKKRYNLKASVRKLMEDRSAKVVYCETSEEKLAFFDEFFILHERRAQERGINSSLKSKAFRDHHKQVIKDSDYARIYALRLDGQTISVVYGFLFADRFYYYQVAHDPEFAKFSPGKVLLFKVIENCSELGCKEFNFLQGDEDYKRFWAQEKRQLYRLTLEKENFRMQSLHWISNMKHKIKLIRN
jgi:CelD/BcsL family acetyltransferase involved in cellulose biosynthesis